MLGIKTTRKMTAKTGNRKDTDDNHTASHTHTGNDRFVVRASVGMATPYAWQQVQSNRTYFRPPVARAVASTDHDPTAFPLPCREVPDRWPECEGLFPVTGP